MMRHDIFTAPVLTHIDSLGSFIQIKGSYGMLLIPRRQLILVKASLELFVFMNKPFLL